MGAAILGMPGPWAEDIYEASDYYTTKIGGLPDWPILKDAIRPELLKCRVCGRSLCLVSQVNAPISSGSLRIEERIIYILGCVMPSCGSNSLSWRTLRVQKSYSGVESSSADHERAPSAASCGLMSTSNKDWWKEDLWTRGCGEEYDDGNDEDVNLEELGRALSEASHQASQSKKQNDHKQTESVVKGPSVKQSVAVKDLSIPVVPCFYIYSQEEATTEVSSICANSFSLSFKENPNLLDDHGEEEKWEREGYEYDKALNVDRMYMKFKKRMEANPEQCFRYSYGGNPLLATIELGEPGTCGLCGGSRHYEMQLMPPLLYFLHQAADGSSMCSPEDWNWMTLIIYTCSKSCSLPSNEDNTSNGWTVAEEATIIQFE